MRVSARPGGHRTPAAALSTIVLAELLGVSVWFTPNAVADQLALAWALGAVEIGHLTWTRWGEWVTLLLAVGPVVGVGVMVRGIRVFGSMTCRAGRFASLPIAPTTT